MTATSSSSNEPRPAGFQPWRMSAFNSGGTSVRPRLKVVPRAGVAPAGEDQVQRLGRPAKYGRLATNLTCYCGVGRVATERYMCTTCARWLRHYREVTARRLAWGAGS